MSIETDFEDDIRKAVKDGEALLTKKRRRPKVMGKFREKLEELGAVGAAKWAIRLPQPTSGYTELYEADPVHKTGLKLTCEWFATRPKYESLFADDPDIIPRATWILREYEVLPRR